MRFIIGLSVLVLCQAKVIEECDLVSVRNVNHEKEILKSGIMLPYQMVIDYDTNTLFFSYTSNGENEQYYDSAFLNLNTQDYGVITDIESGFANAVDSKTNKVHLGGRNGVYEFNYDTKTAQHIGAEDYNIWNMFFKDQLYFVAYPNGVAYTFKDGVVTEVPELNKTKAKLIVVDERDDIYFSNSSGLFCHKKIEQETVQLGDYNLTSLSTDKSKKLFFTTQAGFYSIEEDYNIKELAKLDDVYGMVVDGDNNIIYATNDSIIRLKPTNKTCGDYKNKVVQD